MMENIRHTIRSYLEKNTTTARMVYVLERTPTHAVHWYVLLATAIIIVCAGVVFAWVVFAGIPAHTRANMFAAAQPETIQRAELTEAIDTLRAREVLFERLMQIRPTIVDPGR